MKKGIFAFLAALLLVGCTPAEPAVTTAPITDPTVPTTVETVPEPVYVYPGAIEDYLGQIHDYSWDREYAPEYVMLHFCSAVVNHPDDPYAVEYVRQTFIDADVSIHYLIDREGTVYCYIPESRVAWHAGKGTWLGQERFTNKMNFYAIGIELMGIGSMEDMSLYLTKQQYNALPKEHLGFTDAQYTALKALVSDICQRNNIPMDRQHVIGHQDYSPKKNDPGQLFDWARLLGEEQGV